MTIPRRLCLAIALAAILPYHVGGLLCVYLHLFAPMWLGALVYFAHFAGVGGLVGFAVSVRRKKPNRCVFWGAVIGVLISALLMA
jgi:hypothetical protein